MNFRKWILPVVFLFTLHSCSNNSQEENCIDEELIDENNIRLWQSNIAHVPQNVYLSDSSIIDNIAFGVPKDEIDFEYNL